jgi:hypothetical protein
MKVHRRGVSQNGFCRRIYLQYQAGGVQQHHSARQVGEHRFTDVFGFRRLSAIALPQPLELRFLLLEALDYPLVCGQSKGGAAGVDGAIVVARLSGEIAADAPYQPHGKKEEHDRNDKDHDTVGQHRIGKPVHR